MSVDRIINPKKLTQTGSFVSLTGSFGSDPIITDRIERLSVQIVTSGSTIQPFPVYTAAIQVTNDDPQRTGGDQNWFTTATLSVSSSAASFSSNSKLVNFFSSSVCALNSRVTVTSTNLFASGTLDMTLFGQG